MGAVGDCFDIAMWEKVHATLARELLDSWPFATKAEARPGIFEFVETECNGRRLDLSLGKSRWRNSIGVIIQCGASVQLPTARRGR